MAFPATPAGTPARPPAGGIHHDVRNAWIAVTLLPVAFVLAMLLGEGLLALRGYEGTGDETIPLATSLLAGGPAVLVLAAPGVAAAVFGLRAYHHGQQAGLVPALIGSVLAFVTVVLNATAFLVAY